MRSRDASCLLSLFVLAACAGGQSEAPTPAPSQDVDVRPAEEPQPIAKTDAPTPSGSLPNEHAPLVREIAADYKSWGAVDNQMHWAPGLCAMPAEGVQHMSDAPADTPHGSKVFVLHALDALGFWISVDTKGKFPRSLAPAAAPPGGRKDVEQVLVKESFVPRKLEGGHAGARMIPAKRGDEYFGAGDPIGLFVMAKLAGEPAGTDAGWIYATVGPGGEVTASGDIAACRDCHAKAAGRVFGIPLHWKQ